MRNLTFENLKMIIKKRQEECFNELKREIKKMERDIETFIARFCESTTNQATREYLQSLQRIFGRALAREVSVGRYSVDTPNNSRREFADVFFVMRHSFQHLTCVEPCTKQTIHLNIPLFTGQILK